MFGCGHDSEINFLRDLVTKLQKENADLATKLALLAEPSLAARLVKRPEPPPDAPGIVNMKPRSIVRSARAFREGARMDIPPANVFLTPDPRTPES